MNHKTDIEPEEKPVKVLVPALYAAHDIFECPSYNTLGGCMVQGSVTAIGTRVIEVIVERLAVDREDIHDGSRLLDLAQVSNNLGGLKQALQDEFNFEFGSGWKKISTVEQLVDFVQKNAKPE